MSGHSFARAPSEKQARERERSGFEMRMPGQGVNPDVSYVSHVDQDARLAEIFHDRLELGATSLEESKAERLSLKMARLAAEVLSETELKELTRSFVSLGRTTAGALPESRDGLQHATGTPNVSNRPVHSRSSYPTPPSTGHMDWSPAGDTVDGDRSDDRAAGSSADRHRAASHPTQPPSRVDPNDAEIGEAKIEAASSFKFSASTGPNAAPDTEKSNSFPHKRPSPRKLSGRRHRPRAQIATASQAPKAPSPAKAPAPPVAAHLFNQDTASNVPPTAVPLKPTRSDTSRSASVIREALATANPQDGATDANPAPTASSSQPRPLPQTSFTFDTTAAASRPTAPLPQMFTVAFAAAGLATSKAPDAKGSKTSRPHPGVSAPEPGVPTASASSTKPSEQADAAVPINPFSPGARVSRDAAAGRGALSPNKPAAAAPAAKTAVPEAKRAFTFGSPSAAKYTGGPSSHTAEACDHTAARAPPGSSAEQDGKPGPAQEAPRAAPQPVAAARGGFGFLQSPKAKAAGTGAGAGCAAAPNPFGSPMTPLERSGAAGLDSRGDRRPVQVNLFGAEPAAAGAPATPLFQAQRNTPVAGATPPSTDGPSTAGSPFGGLEGAQNWFPAPASGGSAARRRGGRVLRRHRDNIHATGRASTGGTPPAATADHAEPAAQAVPPFFGAPPPPPWSQARRRDSSGSDGPPDVASSASESSTRAFAGTARTPEGGGRDGAPQEGAQRGPASLEQTPTERAAGLRSSPMSTGLPGMGMGHAQAAAPPPPPLAARTPPRQRYTARRPADAQPDASVPRWGHQAKENHIPPNVPRPGGGAAPAADDSAAKLAAADKLRRQGNQMFKESRWAEAAAEYTRSVDALQSLGRRAPAETTALLLGNRAAARMMQGRVKEALADCNQALKVQPWFTRAIERAAKCHLRLGDFAAADALLSEAQARPQVPPADARALMQRLAEVRQSCSEIDEAWAALAAAETADAAAVAERDARRLLDRVCEAFDVKLLLAAALLRGGQWRLAEEAAMAAAAVAEGPRGRLQAWWLRCEVLYAEGDLEKCVWRMEDGLGDLEALERTGAGGGGGLERGLAGGSLGDRVPLPAVAVVRERIEDMRQVLQGRSAGNAAFTAKRYEEAARLYTLALGERRVASPAFWAKLHSNRAAAYQAQEKWVDALADCGRARALDPSFHKVLSRLATLHEATRRPAAALGFLQQLQVCPGGPAAAGGAATLRRRLADLRIMEARGGTPHHFHLLHLPLTASASDVKTAYRKLAIVYHPDKARSGCVYASSLSGPPMTVREASLHDRVVAAADDLFKVINEACTVLSDNVKRDKCARELGGGGASQYTDAWSFAYGEDDPFDFDLPPRRPHAFGRRKPGHSNFW